MSQRCIYHPTRAPESETIDDTKVSLKSKIQEGWVDTPDKFRINFWAEKLEGSISEQCEKYLSGEIPGIDSDNCVNEDWRCKVWNTLTSEETMPDGDKELIDSPRTAGEYYITGRAMCLLESRQDDERFRARLTSWLIDQRQLGFEQPKITEETLRDIEQRQDLTVHRRADRLLQFVNRQTPEIGKVISFTNQHIHAPAMAWSESSNPREVVFLLRYLRGQNWLKDATDPSSSIGGEYVLTVPGYAHLAELEKTATVSSQAFVAMWFDETMANAWKMGIESGISDAGYIAKRIDRKEHNNKIDDEIIAEIRRSRYVVADFTQGDDGARGGVYYEAGFARGLGIEVIPTCRKDSLEKVHLDMRQYNHIVWEEPEKLREALANRISATIGDGPLMTEIPESK